MVVNATPSMAQVLKDAIDGRLAELHTAMPALVESYDAATGFAAVSPCLKRKYVAGDLVELPVINNVPVLFPRGGNAAITFELQKGDVVLLVFAERSVDRWKTAGGKVDPKDPRKHALSDAFAIPGGYPRTSPPSTSLITAAFGSDGSLTVTAPASSLTVAADGSLNLENDAGGALVLDATGAVSATSTAGGIVATLSITGKVSLVNATGVDFVAQLLLAIDKLVETTKVATSMGLQPLIPDALYTAERAKLDTFKA